MCPTVWDEAVLMVLCVLLTVWDEAVLMVLCRMLGKRQFSWSCVPHLVGEAGSAKSGES